jgi:hypothetical protein
VAGRTTPKTTGQIPCPRSRITRIFADHADKSKPPRQPAVGAGLHKALFGQSLLGEAAVKTYNQILMDYPDNGPVAARALLRMGRCN